MLIDAVWTAYLVIASSNSLPLLCPQEFGQFPCPPPPVRELALITGELILIPTPSSPLAAPLWHRWREFRDSAIMSYCPVVSGTMSVCRPARAAPTAGMSKLFHKGPVWLQVFVPTSQEHTVWPINFLKTEISWLNESGLVCCCLAGTKTCTHTGPLWNSLDMPVLQVSLARKHTGVYGMCCSSLFPALELA